MIILHSAHCAEKKVILEWKINHFYLHKHNYFYHTHLPDVTTLPPLLQKICPQATLLCVRGSGTDACGRLCRNDVKEVQQVMDCIHVGNTQLTANDIGTLLNWQTVVHTDQLLMHYYRPCCVVISALAAQLTPINIHNGACHGGISQSQRSQLSQLLVFNPFWKPIISYGQKWILQPLTYRKVCPAMGTAVCWWLGSDSWNWRGAD